MFTPEASEQDQIKIMKGLMGPVSAQQLNLASLSDEAEKRRKRDERRQRRVNAGGRTSGRGRGTAKRLEAQQRRERRGLSKEAAARERRQALKLRDSAAGRTKTPT